VFGKSANDQERERLKSERGVTLEARQVEALGLAKCADYFGNVPP
jgi:hypothetical protein